MPGQGTRVARWRASYLTASARTSTAIAAKIATSPRRARCASNSLTTTSSAGRAPRATGRRWCAHRWAKRRPGHRAATAASASARPTRPPTAACRGASSLGPRPARAGSGRTRARSAARTTTPSHRTVRWTRRLSPRPRCAPLRTARQRAAPGRLEVTARCRRPQSSTRPALRILAARASSRPMSIGRRPRRARGGCATGRGGARPSGAIWRRRSPTRPPCSTPTRSARG
mmetsp:Transcript_13193/g.33711  ORF Transcript_13193/g.33711 Transcript_13193/m.33711 type:complete len:230 (+) Transcript_13193:409-1098(+)